MLRTQTHLVTEFVPPPDPVPGHFKKVLVTVVTDLESRHTHTIKKDWTPEGASDEELAAAKKIDAMRPPGLIKLNVGQPLDETAEEYHTRTAGEPGAMDVSSQVERLPPVEPPPAPEPEEKSPSMLEASGLSVPEQAKKKK